MIRLLVCGGRTYFDGEHVYRTLDRVKAKHEIEVLIQGGARGADELAKCWALAKGVPWVGFPIDHALDGPWPGAGPARNRHMLHEGKPTAVVAFPSTGTGTDHMCRIAGEAGVKVWRVKPPTKS